MSLFLGPNPHSPQSTHQPTFYLPGGSCSQHYIGPNAPTSSACFGLKGLSCPPNLPPSEGGVGWELALGAPLSLQQHLRGADSSLLFPVPVGPGCGNTCPAEHPCCNPSCGCCTRRSRLSAHGVRFVLHQLCCCPCLG